MDGKRNNKCKKAKNKVSKHTHIRTLVAFKRTHQSFDKCYIHCGNCVNLDFCCRLPMLLPSNDNGRNVETRITIEKNNNNWMCMNEFRIQSAVLDLPINQSVDTCIRISPQLHIHTLTHIIECVWRPDGANGFCSCSPAIFHFVLFSQDIFYINFSNEWKIRRTISPIQLNVMNNLLTKQFNWQKKKQSKKKERKKSFFLLQITISILFYVPIDVCMSHCHVCKSFLFSVTDDRHRHMTQ